MNNEIDKIFESMGIPQNEGRLYLVLLESGPSSAIGITQRMGVTRQMFYFLLPAVMSKGLVKQVRVGNKNLYQAVAPDVLFDLHDKTRKELNEIIPVLKSRQVKDTEVPLITVYDNILSMREWYRRVLDTAKSGDEMLIWSCGKNWFNLDAKFYESYLQKKAKIGIIEKVLKPDEPQLRTQYAEIKRENAEWRFYSKGWQANTEKIIWRDEVSFLTLKEQSTNLIVIESEGLAELERYEFYQSWDHL